MGVTYIRVEARKLKNFKEILQKLSVKEKFCSGKAKHNYAQMSKGRCHGKPKHDIIHPNHSW